MIEQARLRLRLLAAEYGVSIAAVLALIAVLSVGVGAMTVVAPPTDLVTEQTDQQRVETALGTHAVVHNDTQLWDAGTRLSNSSLYPTDAAPELTAVLRTSVPTKRTVEVDQTIALVIEGTRDESTFYRDRRMLARSSETVSDGSVTDEATIDIPALQSELDRIREEVAGVGRIQARLVADVSYDTGSYEGTLSASAPLVITDRGYWVDGALTDSADHARTVRREVPQAGYQTEGAQWLVLGLVFAGGASLALLIDRRGLDVSDIRRDLAEVRYAEWISAGELPMWVGQTPVRLEELSDVVDVGIDNNKRVIHDHRRRLFAVIDGDLVYYYSHESDWSEVAWPAVGEPSAEYEGEPRDLAAEHNFGFGDSPFQEPEE